MWPWEHVAVGYLLYSLSVRVLWGRPPTRGEALAVVAAAVLPDLVDKPLAWELHLLNGKSLGHSLAFAVSAAVLAWLRGGRRIAAAVGFGLVSHQVADVAYRVALGRNADWTFVIWPLVDRPPADAPGLLANARYWLSVYGEFLASPRGRVYLALEVAVLAGAFLLWVRDGRPGVGVLADRSGGDADPLGEP